MADEVLKDLQLWYEPLVGMTFQATLTKDYSPCHKQKSKGMLW